MKKLCLLLLLPLFFEACSPEGGDTEIDGYTNMHTLENKYVYLKKMENGRIVKMDSSLVKRGRFFFKEKADSSEVVYFYVGGKKMKEDVRPMLLENGNIHINVSEKGIRVYGTPVNQSYQKDYLNMQKYYLKKREEILSAFYGARRDSTDSGLQKSLVLENRYNDLYTQVAEAYSSYLENNIGNPLGQLVFGRVYRRLSYDQLERICEKSDARFRSSPYGKSAYNRLAMMEKVSAGHNFTDFVSMDPRGMKVSLSDYAGKGKYLLMYFWASWSIPCMKDLSGLLSLYYQYKDDNFDMLGVSLDNNPGSWGAAMKSSGQPWSQISDLKSWESDAVKKYVIQKIPYFVLIDAEGKIVSNSSSLNNIYDKLNGIFTNKEH